MIEQLICDFLEENSYVRKEDAINDNMVGLKIFDNPLVGYASATDQLFNMFKEDYSITYGKFLPPTEWLKNANTVISIFFPYTHNIKNAVSEDKRSPSSEWLHGRYEGQQIINNCTDSIIDHLNDLGYNAIAPCNDKRFEHGVGALDSKSISINKFYYSNWSERHVAFACGLGTFGLSKGLITSKGMAGRFSSIITNYTHIPTERTYKGSHEYCTMCGKCISSCPVRAISYRDGKDHKKCSRFLEFIAIKHQPRSGCGKCQVKLPCSDRIPIRL